MNLIIPCLEQFKKQLVDVKIYVSSCDNVVELRYYYKTPLFNKNKFIKNLFNILKITDNKNYIINDLWIENSKQTLWSVYVKITPNNGNIIYTNEVEIVKKLKDNI